MPAVHVQPGIDTARQGTDPARQPGGAGSAGACHIAQPALSQQIKQLETHLGIQLFDRSTRRVEITPAGERFTT
ncbi:LysR family transcriptional regulator, partial [Nocardia abscessus]|uniref:LysR family transcriptional regulator n=1 Tax=Nocardia abscessus TaxID=120957 RepID=UPI002456CA1F